MSMFRHLFRGLRALANRKAVDQDIADEVASYLERPPPRWWRAGFLPMRHGALRGWVAMRPPSGNKCDRMDGRTLSRRRFRICDMPAAACAAVRVSRRSAY